ncbi:MAG: hypothetical protein KAJ16_01555 [Calditrichia bacterium]|nr:hypothetical protein [Calditrichia bacterium]
MRRFTPLLIIGALLIFVFIIGIIYGDSGVTNSFWNPIEPPSFEDQATWSPYTPPGVPDIATWSPYTPPGVPDIAA